MNRSFRRRERFGGGDSASPSWVALNRAGLGGLADG